MKRDLKRSRKPSKDVEEIISPDDLRVGFNIVPKEYDEFDYGRRFYHAKYWTERILKMSIFMLGVSFIALCTGAFFFVTKPAPAIYATMSNNALYRLPSLTHDEAIAAVNQARTAK